MWSHSSTVLQLLTSLEKQPILVANRVCGILQLTAMQWVALRPYSSQPRWCGHPWIVCNCSLNSCWLTGRNFLETSDFPIKPPDDFRQKLKFNKSADSTKVIETKEYHCSTIFATVIEIATTFERQKYSSHEKLLRIVAYMLRLLPKNESKRTDIWFISDPAELDDDQQRLFHLVQLESLNTE